MSDGLVIDETEGRDVNRTVKTFELYRPRVQRE